MVIRKMEVYVLDIIMEVALACVISAGGIGGIIIAVVKYNRLLFLFKVQYFYTFQCFFDIF